MTEIESCKEGHKANISGYCNKCGTATCSQCVNKEHFDHHEALTPYDLTLSQTVNSLVKMKGCIVKEIAKYDSTVKEEDLIKTRQVMVDEIREGYAKFRLALKNHLINYIRDIRGSKCVNKLKTQQYTLSVSRVELLRNMLKEMKSDLAALMDAVYEEKYAGQIPRLNRIDQLKSKLKFMEKAQTCELRNFEAALQELKSSTIEASPVANLFKVQHIDSIDVSVYKVSRDTGTLIKYGIHTSALASLDFDKYTPPYNSSIVEIAGFVYILGGCLVEGTPKDDRQYSDSITELDPFLKTAKTKSTLLRRRICFGAVAHSSDFVYVAGGYNHTGLISGCEKFSLTETRCTELPSLPMKKSNCALCLIKGRYLYCIGGYSTEGETAAIDMLDVAESGSSEWTSIIRESTIEWHGAQNPGVVAISNKEILIFGGKSRGETVNDTLIFATDKDVFTEVGGMQDCDTFLACRPILYKDKVYTFSCHENHLHTYDLKEKKWNIKKELIEKKKSSARRQQSSLGESLDNSY